jgi:hypothetical protein
MSSIKQSVINNPLTVLVVLYFLGKFTLYYNMGLSYLEYFDTESSFFPAFYAYLNPFYLDMAVLAMLLINKRWSFAIGALLNIILLIHPQGFGIQHYVMSLYMFIWLTVKDSNDHSIFFGRVTLSFLFMAATIGKLTPGWISGEHYDTHLPWLNQHPALIIGGEFVLGIAFLLPFYIGVCIPIIIVAGMIYSISFVIFDAMGPILGMALAFLAIRETKRDVISVSFSSMSILSLLTHRFIKFFKLSVFESSINHLKDGEENLTTQVTDQDGNIYTGYNAYCEIIARVPMLAFLYPFLTGNIVRYMFKY